MRKCCQSQCIGDYLYKFIPIPRKGQQKNQYLHFQQYFNVRELSDQRPICVLYPSSRRKGLPPRQLQY